MQSFSSRPALIFSLLLLIFGFAQAQTLPQSSASNSSKMQNQSSVTTQNRVRPPLQPRVPLPVRPQAQPQMRAAPLAQQAPAPQVSGAANMEQNQALQQTQQFLNNPSERNAYIASHPGTQQMDQNVKNLAGSDQNAEAIYQLSSQVMEQLVGQAKGDPAKMSAILEQAQRDPAAFAASWSPEQQAALHKISSEIESKKTPISKP